MNITAFVESFANQLVAAVEASTAQRIQAAIASAFGAPQKSGLGRPAVASVATKPATAKKGRPKQFCPVPGCENVAAPVFGMVCAEHKNVAKSKIKKYREERRTTPAKAAKPATAKPATAKPAAAQPVTAKKVLSPKAARARKIQGQYMGALKSLTGADRDRVRQTAQEKGVAEAVKLAKTLRKSPK